MFHKVQHRELTNKNWTTEFKHDVAPNVMALIELFDAVGYTTLEILHPKLQAAQRASMVAFFIDVAEACYRMNNFNTHAEIVVGLTAPCIKQLETTWNLVAPGHLEKFEHLKHVSEGQPRLPSIFIVVKDLFGFEESMRTIENGLIHFQKFRKVYHAITDALSCQHTKYTAPSRRRRVLHPDKNQQMVLKFRLETIRKTGTELFWLAKKANKQESVLFVNSLADAGFM
ncbi:hypothetical protein DYB32_002583 [Aphanomyces invadans]|uniref:Ras-GEF domain-containing protein n=1 Tax=Aphanomyces invadans TaxID=157072 RepID=A0A3R7ACH2_9STRA|nr:hypothetical protein DYB32_002583 [Aphanomyces invadans]